MVFSKVSSTDEKGEDCLKLALSYYRDATYFFEKGDVEKAFELQSYVWGILDCLARLQLLKVTEDIRKWFKI